MFFFLCCLAVIHKEQRPRIRGSASPALFSVCVLWRSPIVGRPASCSPNENDIIVVKPLSARENGSEGCPEVGMYKETALL
jgi:hypothetical protein